MFLDGFEAIQRGEAGLDVPIFAAMSPIDKVSCWPALKLPAAWRSTPDYIAEVTAQSEPQSLLVCVLGCALQAVYYRGACLLTFVKP